MKIITPLTITLLTLFQSVSFAQNTQFVEGKDYDIVSNKKSKEPLLEEFFNYACGACFSTEQFITRLKKNNPKLHVKSVPVELRESWKIYVEAYYIGEKLGILDKSHSKLFDYIHVEKKQLNNQKDMKKFFFSLGVDEKAYDGVAGSFWLNTQRRKAKRYAKQNQVMGTPVFLVNKKYKINTKALGSHDLIEKAIIELSGLNKTNKTATR